MHERPPTGEGPTPTGVPLATLLVSGIVASTAILVGMAVLAGWLYTREYYRQFGIEPSALNFSPYEYALRARQALALVVAAFVGALLGSSAAVTAHRLPESHPLPRLLGTQAKQTPTERAAWNALMLTTVGVTAVAGIVDWFTVKRGFYLLAILAGLAIWSSYLTHWLLERRRELFFFGAASLVFILWILLFMVPAAQGEVEGRRHHDDLQRFPAVSLVAAEELGLPQQQPADLLHKYGPYRLVLRNGGMYYLVAEDEPGETLAVPEDSITYLEIHAER